MSFFKRLLFKRTEVQRQSEQHVGDEDTRYPVWPPHDPVALSADPDKYLAEIRCRQFWAPKGVLVDNSLFGLYRFYEYIFTDYTVGYRDQLEYYWRKPDWRLSEIPDPKDDNPVRYAALACCVNFMLESFNTKVKQGLRRGAPAISTHAQMEAYRATPEHEKLYETLPVWVLNVSPLEIALTISTSTCAAPQSAAEEGIDSFCLSKNIIMWTPAIHFT